jgi:ABC-type transport system involved in Fe-S cluster assembly, permease and ATPase components
LVLNSSGIPGKIRFDQVRPGSTRFENVSFGYHPDHPILKIAFLAIPAERVVIVGPSGIGESTILRLVKKRFYGLALDLTK